jgi:hypothetical protein
MKPFMKLKIMISRDEFTDVWGGGGRKERKIGGKNTRPGRVLLL